MAEERNVAPALLIALAGIDGALRDAGLEYCIIGGIAVGIRGEPRFTRDIDLTLVVEPESEQSTVDLLLSRFMARRADAREFALQTKVALLSVEGVPVDVAIGLTQFEHRAVRRASMVSVAPGLAVPVCAAEDLIVYKCIAGRDRDLLDVASVVRRNPDLDTDYIRHALREFAEYLEGGDFEATFDECLRKARLPQ